MEKGRAILLTGIGGSKMFFPFMFVMLYGTGFVGAKYGLPYAEPATFLSYRFCLSALVVALASLFLKANWPKKVTEFLHIAIAGLMTVGTFSIGAFVAIDQGLSPALTALIIALQPIIVAVVARRLLGENLSLSQWGGLGLGLLGVVLVVGQKLSFTQEHMFGLAMAVVGLLGLSFGNLYQKRFCANMDVVSGGIIQSFSSCLLCLPFAFFLEREQTQWTWEFAGALGYMSIGVSIGALSLLYLMIRRAEISQVASVFYFVPVSAAIVSAVLFDSQIDLFVFTGIAITALGVFFVNRKVGYN